MATNNKQQSTELAPFGQVAPIKRPQGAGLLLQWFNALPAGKEFATGWHIQADRCPEALSDALKKLGCARRTVLHRMSKERVVYWALETVSLIVLCNGFGDSWEMRESEERQGIAWGWIDTKNHSKLKCRVFVAELAEAGYIEPFIISLEGMITDEFLQALARQFEVLDAYERETGTAAPFYGFSLTMAPAEETKLVGNHGKQSPIVPMVAQVPDAIDYAYLREHLCPAALLAKIAEQDLLAKAVQWSVDVSRRISAGEDREAWETAEYEEALEHEDKGQPSTAQQWASIEKLCERLNRDIPEEVLSFEQARTLIREMISQVNKQNNRKAK